MKTISMAQNKIPYAHEIFYSSPTYRLFLSFTPENILPTYLQLYLKNENFVLTNTHTPRFSLTPPWCKKTYNLGMTSRDTFRHLSSKSCLASSFSTFINILMIWITLRISISKKCIFKLHQRGFSLINQCIFTNL